MKVILIVVFAYVVAAPLTDLISYDMRQTEWLNILTYFYLIFGTTIWTLIFLCFGGICAAAAYIFMIIFNR